MTLYNRLNYPSVFQNIFLKNGMSFNRCITRLYNKGQVLSIKAPEGFELVIHKKGPNLSIRPFDIWLPERNDFRRGLQAPVITIDYGHFSEVKKTKTKAAKKPKKKKHIIHKAVRWKKMLDDGSVNSMSEIARIEGLTRARVTQIMNLLKLPAEMQEFLIELDNPKEILKYSERKLRNIQDRV